MAAVLLVPEGQTYVGSWINDGCGFSVPVVICAGRIRYAVVDRVYRVECSYYDFGVKIAKYYYLLLAFITLEESVVSAMYIGWTSWTRPSQAGDAANLAQQTFMPALFWGTLFALFALWCAKERLDSSSAKKARQVPRGRNPVD